MRGIYSFEDKGSRSVDVHSKSDFYVAVSKGCARLPVGLGVLLLSAYGG